MKSLSDLFDETAVWDKKRNATNGAGSGKMEFLFLKLRTGKSQPMSAGICYFSDHHLRNH